MENTTKKNRFGLYILTVIYSIIVLLFIGLLIYLNLLPAKYIYPIVAGLVLISVVIFIFILRKKTKRLGRIALILISIFLVIGLMVGSYYLMRTIVFLERMVVPDTVPTENYLILTTEDSEYLPEIVSEELSFKEKIILFLFPEEVVEDPDDAPRLTSLNEISDTLDNQVIGTYISSDRMYSEAKGKIKGASNVSYSYEENEMDLYNKLLDGTYNFIIIPKSVYELLTVNGVDLKHTTDMLYEIKLEKETSEDGNRVFDVSKDSYNILISGADFYGTFASDCIHRSDVNMILTINPTTNEVHLTSIPRDYYVVLHSYGERDKLTHSSLKGMDELEMTIEDTLGIEIDYYVRANFNCVVQFINAIGGIDVDVERACNILLEYNGSKTWESVSAGVHHFNGVETLAFARERHSFTSGSEGDLQRIRDQQLVIEAVLNKVTQSTTILTSYLDILNALGRRIETNIPQEVLSKIVKTQLETMPSWTITKTAISTDFGWEICYLAQYYGDLCVAYVDEEQNAICRDEIFRVMGGGKVVEVLDDEVETQTDENSTDEEEITETEENTEG